MLAGREPLIPADYSGGPGHWRVSVPLSAGPDLPRKLNSSVPDGVAMIVTTPFAQLPCTTAWLSRSVLPDPEVGVSWPAQEKDAPEYVMLSAADPAASTSRASKTSSGPLWVTWPAQVPASADGTAGPGVAERPEDGPELAGRDAGLLRAEVGLPCWLPGS